MKLDGFEMGDEIGRGGMGAVYRGTTPDGKPVAIKVLLQPGEGQALARFQREQRLQALLTGGLTGFVPLLGMGLTARGPYLVMPFLTGGTLRSLVGRGPLSAARTIEIGRAIAWSLGEAHARGIIHRDLKPENVLFEGGDAGALGRPLIADLGLAKHFDTDAEGGSKSVALSLTGEMRGTLHYMAYEQIQDAKNVGPQADVYALGAILYECLTGGPPFSAVTPQALFDKIAAGAIAPVRELRADAPRPLAAVIERCLMTDPAERYPDGAAVALALDAAAAAPAEAAGRRLPLVGAIVAGAVLVGALGLAVSRRSGAPKDVPESVASSPAAPVPPPKAGPDASHLVAEGRDALGRGDPGSALAAFTRAIGVDASCAAAWSARATLHVKRKEIGEAIDDATHALALDPKLVEAISARAMAYEAIDLGKALEDGDRWCELAPKDPAARLHRGTVRERRGELAQANADLDRAIELDPRLAAAYAERGRTHVSSNEWDAAIADLDKAIKFDPAMVPAWVTRAEAHLRKGDREAAISDADEAIRLRPREVRPYRIRGDAYWQGGNMPRAQEEFTRCIEIDPRAEVKAFYYRATIRTQLENNPGAIEDYQKFLEIAPPDDVDVPRARELLAHLRGS